MSITKGVKDNIAPACRLAEERGCTVRVERMGSGHVRVTFERDGKSRFITVAQSGSDHRIAQNVKRDARAVLRLMGWL